MLKDKQDRVEEMCHGQPCQMGEGYCVLKEIVLHDAHYNPRLLVQAECVNRFKLDESARQGQDIGWREAWRMWVESGHAARFAAAYGEDLPVAEIYRRSVAA